MCYWALNGLSYLFFNLLQFNGELANDMIDQ